VNFTREPIIETIISAKDGYKLSLRSTKNVGQEEYLVDAIEVVSFGGTFFYRSKERPKAFFLPASDYEVLEVRETRLLVKQPSIDKSIKIGGGKESSKTSKSSQESKTDVKGASCGKTQEKTSEQPQEKKKNRRQKKSSEQAESKTSKASEIPKKEAKKSNTKEVKQIKEDATQVVLPAVLSQLLQPPENLISDSLKKYKKNEIDPTVKEVKDELAPQVGITIAESENARPIAPEVPLADSTLISEPPKANEHLEGSVSSEQFYDVTDDKNDKMETSSTTNKEKEPGLTESINDRE